MAFAPMMAAAPSINIYCKLGGVLTHWNWEGDDYRDGVAAAWEAIAPAITANVEVSPILAVIIGGKA